MNLLKINCRYVCIFVICANTLFIAWCWNQESSNTLSWLFWVISKKYSEHPWVSLSKIYNSNSIIQENKEIHLTWIMKKEVFTEIPVLSWTNSDLNYTVHLFDTIQIIKNDKQLHKLNIKVSFDLENSKNIWDLNASMMLLTDISNNNHYIFIENIESTIKLKNDILIDTRIALLSSQKNKRIKIWNYRLLDYLQWWWLINFINNNWTNIRVMQWLDNADIYASEWPILKSEVEILWNQENVVLEFIKDNIYIVLSKSNNGYWIVWDYGKEEFWASIEGDIDYTVRKNKSTVKAMWNIEFPRGLSIDFQTRSATRLVDSVTTDIQIPNRYIDFKKIIP